MTALVVVGFYLLLILPIGVLVGKRLRRQRHILERAQELAAPQPPSHVTRLPRRDPDDWGTEWTG